MKAANSQKTGNDDDVKWLILMLPKMDQLQREVMLCHLGFDKRSKITYNNAVERLQNNVTLLLALDTN